MAHKSQLDSTSFSDLPAIMSTYLLLPWSYQSLFFSWNMPCIYSFALNHVCLKCLPPSTHILLQLGQKEKALLRVRPTQLLLPAFPAPSTLLSQQPPGDTICHHSFMLPASLCLCQIPHRPPGPGCHSHVSQHCVHLSSHQNY